ncbi:hypothetical protein [Novilysobacter arseniciresistens]|uniref:hypothetical protein n=1 Tax=Novilysobacter arseniciresistens TaxID=1385522 RepID=UPI000AD6F1B2|nr:hypothetical protein [Lysobacter arseniciresistens]
MKKTAFCLPLLLLAAGAAQAQDMAGCPQLPAGSDLIWEHRATGDADFCRALRADGTEAFGLYISREATFEPKRSNREEAGAIDGHEIHWYRAELVTKPNIEARETLIELDDGRVAHIWLQAAPGDPLQSAFEMAGNLRFGADRQIAAGQ